MEMDTAPCLTLQRLRHDYHSKTPGPCGCPLFRAPAFTAATFASARSNCLGVAAILTTGRRTVANLLRTAADSDRRRPSVLPSRALPGPVVRLALSRPLDPLPAARHFWPQGRIRLAGDDTITEHPGRKVHGKARHRDPVRLQSQLHRLAAGHKWVVLAAILVSFPFLLPTPGRCRSWSPCITRPKMTGNAAGRPPHPGPTAATAAARPAALVPRLPAVRRRRRRRLHGSHEVASLAGRYPGRRAGRREQMPRRRQLTCRCADRRLAYAGKGRPPCVKGAKLPHAPGGGGRKPSGSV